MYGTGGHGEDDGFLLSDEFTGLSFSKDHFG